MKATIDSAEGIVKVEADGAVRVRPYAGDDLLEDDGWLVIPAPDEPLTDEHVRALRDADQR